MMLRFNALLPVSAAAILFLGSCGKDPIEPALQPSNPNPSYTVPATYNFSNVDYTGQKQRLDMVAEMKTYMNTGNTQGTVLHAQKLKDMYANLNSAFSDASLNNAGKDVKSKTFLPDQPLFETYFDYIAAASESTVAGAEGVAGVVVSSSDPNKKYLCDEKGVEWTQVIEKGLMGSLMYYQSVAVYMDASKIGNDVDNTTVTEGKGTAMEHHWDEAFGYFGVPVDFPSNKTGIRFWGKYCNDRDALLNCNEPLMDAFIKGRAAISNKDYTTRDAQVTIVRNTWEKAIAGTMIHYVNATKSKITDNAVRNHNLSELKGFLMNLKCNPDKIISNAEIAELENALGDNFYEITIANLDLIKNKLSDIYGLNDVKDAL